MTIELSTYKPIHFDSVYRNEVLHKGRIIDNTPEAHARAIFDFLNNELEDEVFTVEREFNDEIQHLEEENEELKEENATLHSELHHTQETLDSVQDFIDTLMSYKDFDKEDFERALIDFNLNEGVYQ